jgi:hypothetical protein
MSKTREAGPDLDAQVAEAFGLPLEPPCPRYHSTDEACYDSTDGVWYGWCYTCGRPISEVEPRARRYSVEIGAAWDVVEAMRGRWAEQENAKWGEPDVWQFHDFADEGWRASVIWLHHDGAIVEVDEIAPTLPLAICRAALAALASHHQEEPR